MDWIERLTHWLLDRGFFGKVGPAWMADGQYSYSVPVYRNGRLIEVVNVHADDEDQAAMKAIRYLAANLYTREIHKQEETDGKQAGQPPGSVPGVCRHPHAPGSRPQR